MAVGMTPSTTSGLELARLVHRYVEQYRYWNLDLFLAGMEPDPTQRSPCDLSVEKPGICFQHNEAFYAIMLTAGWTADRIKRKDALVMMCFVDDESAPRRGMSRTAEITHSIMIVDECFLVDVGFSDNIMRGPIPFHYREEEAVHETSGDRYKFNPCIDFEHFSLPGNDTQWWSICVWVGERWFELYRIPDEKHTLNFEGIVRATDTLYKSPQRILIRDDVLTAAKVTGEARHRLAIPKRSSGIFKPHYRRILLDGSTEVQEIDTWREVEELLFTVFQISLPEDEQVRRRLLAVLDVHDDSN